MNQSQHTPGPWQIGNFNSDKIFSTHVDGPYQVASVAHKDSGVSERAANARLIAAAPDLLAALENLSIVAGAKVDYCGTSWYATSLAGSAVAGPCSTEAEAIAAHRSVIEMHIADAEAAIKAARGEQ